MSLSLLTTSVLERFGLKARTQIPGATPAPPKPETPHQRRERLRQQVMSRGGVLEDIETIRGDCPAQTAQQIGDLSRWLEQH